MKTLVFRSVCPVEFGYMVSLPDDYDAGKLYPMIVFLHGAGERGNGSQDIENLYYAGIGKYIHDKMVELPCVVLYPQCPKGRVWNQLTSNLKELIDKVSESYSVDKKRISLTGLSMGGFGTWEMGMTYPEMFSALAPICGGGMAWRTDALKNKPIWAFHGDKDDCVAISNSYDMVDGARRAGANVKFTIFNGVQHNSWDPAYLDTRVLQWLTEQSL